MNIKSVGQRKTAMNINSLGQKNTDMNIYSTRQQNIDVFCLWDSATRRSANRTHYCPCNSRIQR